MIVSAHLVISWFCLICFSALVAVMYIISCHVTWMPFMMLKHTPVKNCQNVLLSPPKKEVMFLVRSVCLSVCLFVCLSVCLSDRWITRKLVNGF